MRRLTQSRYPSKQEKRQLRIEKKKKSEQQLQKMSEQQLQKTNIEVVSSSSDSSRCAKDGYRSPGYVSDVKNHDYILPGDTIEYHHHVDYPNVFRRAQIVSTEVNTEYPLQFANDIYQLRGDALIRRISTIKDGQVIELDEKSWRTISWYQIDTKHLMGKDGQRISLGSTMIESGAKFRAKMERVRAEGFSLIMEKGYKMAISKETTDNFCLDSDDDATHARSDICNHSEQEM